MATLQEVKDDIVDLHDKVVAGFVDIQARVDALKAQVQAGGSVTAEDLDSVVEAIDSAKADLVSKEGSIA